MTANNKIYDQYASGWWDENNFLHTLKTGINPVRFGYFNRVLTDLKISPLNLRVLDIGCGGGILSEDFARISSKVTGIDPSFASLRAASEHAKTENMQMNYLAGSAEELPFLHDSFDIVICCDVLEHVNDLHLSLFQTSRVLKPGGIFFFDTINRTLQSFFETIFIAQEFPLTRFFAPGSHDWNQFIPPHYLKERLIENALTLREIHGLQPGISPIMTLIEILQLKTGKNNFASFGRNLKYKIGNNMNGSYIGYATKNPKPVPEKY